MRRMNSNNSEQCFEAVNESNVYPNILQPSLPHSKTSVIWGMLNGWLGMIVTYSVRKDAALHHNLIANDELVRFVSVSRQSVQQRLPMFSLTLHQFMYTIELWDLIYMLISKTGWNFWMVLLEGHRLSNHLL